MLGIDSSAILCLFPQTPLSSRMFVHLAFHTPLFSFLLDLPPGVSAASCVPFQLIAIVSCSHVFLRDLNPTLFSYYFLGKDPMYKMRDEMIMPIPPAIDEEKARGNEETARLSKNG